MTFFVRNLFYRLRKGLLCFLRVRTMGARALILKKDSVLLIKHTYQKGWYTVGGAVNRKESPLSAVKREVWEEVGIKTTKDPHLFGIYYNPHEGRDDYVAFYIIKDFTMEENFSSEIAEKRWFKLNKLPEEITPSTRRRIEEYLGKISQSDQW